MTLLLNNSDGKPSLSFTMVYTAFLVAVLWFALSMFDIKHVRAFDVTTVSGFLTPLMALYFGRRWNDAKTPPSEPASPSE
jgi:hypothetical protein